MDPGVAFGKPVIQGTRLPVAVVVGKLAGGMSAGEVAEEYELAREREDVLAALSYATRLLNEEQVLAID